MNTWGDVVLALAGVAAICLYAYKWAHDLRDWWDE